ncbi:hypothetical protein EIL87_04760 [Saccharopolyspora rhizosphaerae]|uniref:Transmembrane protein n=1 Tax=Saccharopolyspora rhizosphaerae TaxID=2492662 RepID=A0A3R8VKH8_9PSEU|nr:hypothetical protein [Saccharopolyspora rhizosphaerae]RRO19411.1 hypothetical protein EIL87_04760 [Saccharopolyspora rhizosphaerae]
MGAALRAHAAWLVNALSFSRNPLRRPIDRLAAGLTLLLLMAAMIAVPVSGMFAGSVHRDLSERAEQAVASSRPVSAVVAEPPSLSIPASEVYSQDAVSSTAVVEWRHGLHGQSARVQVPSSAKVGDRVEVWVDQQGHRVPPPPDTRSVTASAVFAALLLLVVLEIGSVTLIGAVQVGARRIAMNAWAREWEHLQQGGTWSQR